MRFSNDKRPYKNNLGGYLAPGGRKSMQPGYYFHVQPKMYFIAAGKHMPDAAELRKIRNYIAENTKEFLKIIEAKKFRDVFGELNGDRLTRPPKGFDAAHPAIEYLKLKSFTVSRDFTEKEVLETSYPKLIADSFKTAYPLIEFLRRALK